jgi:acetolactate synthase-1/2/3 large subunit
MRVSDLVVKCLENEGVTHVFGVPGEDIEDLLFSLKSSSITFIPTRPRDKSLRQNGPVIS